MRLLTEVLSLFETSAVERRPASDATGEALAPPCDQRMSATPAWVESSRGVRLAPC
jgi:DNA-binding ferritin-like protein (Dps family)